jgi:3-hydroxyisobutyrate dehydrogenase
MAYSRAVKHMGPSGAGQLTKMVNQIAIAGVVQGLAEAIHFAKTAGSTPTPSMTPCPRARPRAGRWTTAGRPPPRARFDFGFAVDWMRKDLGLVLDEARANGATVSVTALVDQFYADVQKLGGRRWDTSSLKARLLLWRRS